MMPSRPWGPYDMVLMGSILRRERKAQGQSLRTLQERTELSQTAILTVERGGWANVGVNTLGVMCAALGLDLSEVLEMVKRKEGKHG